MSQVDKVNYFPLLFWFIILFLVFYALLYIFFIPLVHSSLKVRRLFFGQGIYDFLNLYKNINFIIYFINIITVNNSLNIILYYNYNTIFNELLSLLKLY